MFDVLSAICRQHMMQPGFQGDAIQLGGADQLVNRNYQFATAGNAEQRIILATETVRGDEMLHRAGHGS